MSFSLSEDTSSESSTYCFVERLVVHFLGLLARLARLVLHRLGRDIYGSERGATLGGLWWGGLVVLVDLELLG